MLFMSYLHPVGCLGRIEPMSDVTQLFEQLKSGHPSAAEALLPLVYEELRKLAAIHLQQENPAHSLNATALVHEAYLRLGEHSFGSRTHFMRVAAGCMRRILIDHARSRNAEKRGGSRQRVPLDEVVCWTESPDQLLALEEALQRLAVEEPRKAELVVFRFYAGMTLPEVAQTLGISLPTAERWWAFSRTWLYAELQEETSNFS